MGDGITLAGYFVDQDHVVGDALCDSFLVNLFRWLLLSGDCLSLQFLGLVVRPEGFNKFIDLAFHDEVELVNRKADAVIRDAVLLEVISAYLFGPVAASYHAFALGGQGVVLFLFLYFLKPSSKHAHRFLSILYL